MLIDWQFNIRVWHIGYQKVLDEEFLIYDNYLFIGPFQFKWYSKGYEYGN